MINCIISININLYFFSHYFEFLTPETILLNFNLNFMPLSNWKRLTHYRANIGDRQCYALLFERKSKSLVAVPYNIRLNIKVCIYKYSFSDDVWTKHEIKPTKEIYQRGKMFNTFTGQIYPGAINDKNIYVLTKHTNQIAMLQLIEETNEYKLQIIKKINKIYSYSIGKSIIIKDELHYISQNNHIKYNLNTQQLTVIPVSTSTCPFTTSLIQIKHKIFAFRTITKTEDPSHHIYQYDIEDNHPQTVCIKLPKTIRGILSCTSILNEQLILISGINAIPYRQSEIYIYEVKTEIIKKSNIKMPHINNKDILYKIYATNDAKKDMLVTYGWIRNEYRNMPTVLQTLIRQYYIDEIVHILNSTGAHYKIDVIEILNDYSIVAQNNH